MSAWTPGQRITEGEVKQAMKGFLEASGYRVSVAWCHTRGVDIEAIKHGSRLWHESDCVFACGSSGATEPHFTSANSDNRQTELRVGPRHDIQRDLGTSPGGC